MDQLDDGERERFDAIIERHMNVQEYFFDKDESFGVLPVITQEYNKIPEGVSQRAVTLTNSSGTQFRLKNDTDLKTYLATYISEIHRTDKQILAKYFGKYNQKYLSDLENDLERIKPHFYDAEAVVVIAAKNEIDILKAINSVRDNNKTSCHFLIFNNYTQEDEENGNYDAVQQYLDSLQELDDVSIVQRKMPDYSNVGFAKRVAFDIAMYAMKKNNKTVPMFGVDADVVKFESVGFIDKSVKILQEESAPLAVSTFYDYDELAKDRFPKFGLRSNLMKYINRQSIESRFRRNRIVGSAFGILPEIYALMGGFNPEIGEDILLTKRLRDYVSIRRVANDPIITLDNIVYVNPSKEIKNILDGELPEKGWMSGDPTAQTNKTLRFVWESVDEEAQILSETQPVEIIKDVYDHQYKLANADYLEAPRELVSALMLNAILTVNINEFEIELSNGAVLKTRDDITAFLNSVYKLSNPRFDDIMKIDMTKSRKLWWINEIRKPTAAQSSLGRSLQIRVGTKISRALTGFLSTFQ